MSNSVQLEDLTLYHFHSCPYCAKVRKVIESNGWKIKYEDIQEDFDAFKALRKGGGKTQSPCLKIENDTNNAGKITWMYESDDIINFLNKHLS